MNIDDLFIEEVKGVKEDKNDLISMLFDPYYRSIIGSDEGMPLVELIVAVVMDKSLKEVKGNVKHLSKELLKKKRKDIRLRLSVISCLLLYRYL